MDDTDLKKSDERIAADLVNKIQNLKSKIDNLNVSIKRRKIISFVKYQNHSSFKWYLKGLEKYFVDSNDETDCSSTLTVSDNECEMTSKKLTNKDVWLFQRISYCCKWNWILSQIQSTEFKLHHLNKYLDEIKSRKRKATDDEEETTRHKYVKLDSSKKWNVCHLSTPELIKYLYSNKEVPVDKSVYCNCRDNANGICIICCGMKNNPYENKIDNIDLEKASFYDNSIHGKLSDIDDVPNQLKRNVLFNGCIKQFNTNWHVPRPYSDKHHVETTIQQNFPNDDDEICHGLNLDN